MAHFSQIGMGRLQVTAAALAIVAGAWASAQQATTQPSNPQQEPMTKREALETGQPPASTTEPQWVDQVKNPVPWLTWGADLRVREEYQNNVMTLNGDATAHELDYQRLRARLWATATPTPDVDINVRLAWEGWNWIDPDKDYRPPWDSDMILVDNANVRIRNLGGQPNTLTVGRQDITDLGDGWLIFEGTPLDGSRTSYFNAIRDTWQFKQIKTDLNLIYLNDTSDPDRFIGGIDSQSVPQIEQDEQGAVVWLTNKSIPQTQLDGYFIYKCDDRVLDNGDQGDIYTFGGRAAHDFDEHISGRVQGAYEFGKRDNPALFGDTANTDTLSAYGVNARMVYEFKDSMKNQLRVTYEYLSGDNPHSSTNGQFDPLWGRWPQYSELLVWNAVTEEKGRIAEISNMQRVAFGWQADPTRQLEVALDYHLLFANDNTYADEPTVFSSSGRFRGQLFTGVVRYKFNRYMSADLDAEYFIPGDYYASDARDPAFYLMTELVFTF